MKLTLIRATQQILTFFIIAKLKNLTFLLIAILHIVFQSFQRRMSSPSPSPFIFSPPFH